MKRILTLLLAVSFVTSSFAVVSNYTTNPEVQLHFQDLSAEFQEMTVDDFLSLTPKEYRKVTGKRLGIKNAVKLKAAQKIIKRQAKRGADISEGVYILLAILGLGWLAMGLLSDWDGSDWIINLVLYLLCWLPGLIHALVKKKDYY